jgi:ferrous iron transport protein A
VVKVGEEIPINRVPNNSVVKITKVSTERLRDLGIMEGSVVKVLVATPCGPVIIQREDGAIVVLDTEAASSTLVFTLAVQQVGGYRHRYRWGWRIIRWFSFFFMAI